MLNHSFSEEIFPNTNIFVHGALLPTLTLLPGLLVSKPPTADLLCKFFHLPKR